MKMRPIQIYTVYKDCEKLKDHHDYDYMFCCVKKIKPRAMYILYFIMVNNNLCYVIFFHFKYEHVVTFTVSSMNM